MKFKNWLQYTFPLNEIIHNASSIDGKSRPLPHPIGVSVNINPSNFLEILENLEISDLNNKLCHNGYVRPWCSYGTERRKKELELISSHAFITSNPDKEYGQGRARTHEYTQNFANHKFVCSPEGNGIDCHRHYESLLCKSIPILQIPDEEYCIQKWGKNSCMEKYEDLPVLFVKDYSEISVELLESTYNNFLEKEFNFDKLKKSYWIKSSKTLELNSKFWTSSSDDKLKIIEDFKKKNISFNQFYE